MVTNTLQYRIIEVGNDSTYSGSVGLTKIDTDWPLCCVFKKINHHFIMIAYFVMYQFGDYCINNQIVWLDSYDVCNLILQSQLRLVMK